ncbi:AMP-binding protein [Streptomyces akebiae]|uniref:AMP-binding protein n=1 Tax=Streptomyces akebiae TaxID=2865673 RepID=UPI002175B8C5|nr:AMP-binding protein [Streptomyces akebiae]
MRPKPGSATLEIRGQCREEPHALGHIHKDTAPVVPPRLADYDRARSAFTWARARTALTGLPGGGLNMVHEAVDRHTASDHADKVALRCVARDNSVSARDNSVSTVTYAELARRTSRFANVLRSLGVGPGDRVFTLLGRCPELYTTVLGTLKNTSVLCPLFTARRDPQQRRHPAAHVRRGQLPVPLVIRMTTGAGRQLAAQHSHSLEGWYAHIPGIRVLAPATLEDARHMLTPALADPDPVLIFEHGSLYNVSGELLPPTASVDLDHAAIRRPGTDISLIT